MTDLSPRRAMILAGKELRLGIRQPQLLVYYIALPLVLAAFFLPADRVLLKAVGQRVSTGAEHLLPGLFVLSALLLIQVVGLSLFEERDWHTWERLQVSRARTSEIVMAKAVTPALLIGVSGLVLFVLGGAIFGLAFHWRLLLLVPAVAAFGWVTLSLGLALAAFSRSLAQFYVLQQIAAFGLAAAGGALIPVSAMPAWSQDLARVLPTYWSMRALTSATSGSTSGYAVVGSMAVLVAFAVVFSGVAVVGFRHARHHAG